MIPDWALEQLPSLSIFAELASATFVGSLMRGYSGFGAGLLMAPVFSLLMSPTDVVVLVLGINLLTTFQLLPGALRTVNWRLVWRLFIPSLLGLPIGLGMLHMVDAAVMRKLIAFIVILVSLLMLIGWHYKGRRGLIQDSLAGALSGFMTAIGGIGGPPVILYMLSDRSLPLAVIRAVSLVYFSLAQVVTLAPLAVGGSLTLRQGVYIVVLLPAAVVASLLGAQLHRWSMGKHQERVRFISLFMLLAIGVTAAVV
ncbi:sulfite exporter TauE/SafE family protein [Candidimonas sp. SYP-B2681]|uniref:sulfite exporter TauE/SafE family protein n=1 Tax=Candidimonas sp. SYP-B2681 TaxID=2497686 RepID=UPI000F864734|nr:sulfite exporter TauE/SafE family protein [Candidimonas sp. SYP-B2681]RTZ43286.1 sulfite exporter TauE/SafE family protein [Candidimonas sp. SYP-B2681]